MISDRENENKVKRYASENHYTILANTLGALEYVKYCYAGIRTTAFLRWPKGSDTITVTQDGVIKKFKLTEMYGS